MAALLLGRRESGEPLTTEDLNLVTAVAGQVGRRHRERPALSPAAPQGLRTGPPALVQREHPRVARRWADGAGAGRSDHPVEPGARAAVRSRPAPRRWASRSIGCSTRRWSSVLRAQRRDHPQGASAFRVPLTAAASHRQPRPPREHHDGPAAGDRRRRAGLRHHRDLRGHHRTHAARRAAAHLREDGVARRAGRRRGPRGQHAPDRHLQLHADAARRVGPRGPADGGAREDREADVPRRPHRQRAAAPVPLERRRRLRTHRRRRQRGRRRRAGPARASVREGQREDPTRAGRGQRPGGRLRVQAPAGVPQPVPECARRDAERRLADDRHAPRRATRWWPRCPTPAPASASSTSIASTTRSSPPSPSARARAWACRSRMASCASTTPRSSARAPPVRARGSRCASSWRRPNAQLAAM